MSVAIVNDLSGPKTQIYSFTLILGGISDFTEEMANALYSSGCHDALCGVSHGKPYVAFDRESESLIGALVEAISQVEQIGQGIKVLEVRPPDLDDIELVNSLLNSRAGENSNKAIFGEEAWQLLLKRVAK